MVGLSLDEESKINIMQIKGTHGLQTGQMETSRTQDVRLVEPVLMGRVKHGPYQHWCLFMCSCVCIDFFKQYSWTFSPKWLVFTHTHKTYKVTIINSRLIIKYHDMNHMYLYYVWYLFIDWNDVGYSKRCIRMYSCCIHLCMLTCQMHLFKGGCTLLKLYV